MIPHAKTLIPSHEIDNQLSEQQLAFVGSGNGSLKLNEELQREQFSEVSANKEASFSMRLIILPKTIVDQLKAGRSAQKKKDPAARQDLKVFHRGVSGTPEPTLITTRYSAMQYRC